METYIRQFKDISIQDIPTVGGKNASLGEMFSNLSSRGISVPDGFATTAFAFEEFLNHNHLHAELYNLMQLLDKVNFSNLTGAGCKSEGIVFGSGIACIASGRHYTGI